MSKLLDHFLKVPNNTGHLGILNLSALYLDNCLKLGQLIGGD